MTASRFLSGKGLAGFFAWAAANEAVRKTAVTVPANTRITGKLLEVRDGGKKVFLALRGRGGKDLLVLGPVLGPSQLGREDHEVLAHLVLDEGLAELGEELALLQMPRQDL